MGRGANFLLNIPPDRRGLFHANDSAALLGFKKLVDDNFKTNLAGRSTAKYISGGSTVTVKTVTDRLGNTFQQLSEYATSELSFSFKQPVPLNTVVLREAIKYGQRVQEFEILIDGKEGKTSIKGTTIGRKRIITFPSRNVKTITFKIAKAKAAPLITEVEFYKIADSLVER